MELIETGKNFLLVSIIPQKLSDKEALKDLQEVKALIEAYGGILCDLVTQRRDIHDKGMYIGSGKINEVVLIVEKKHIDVVVLNEFVTQGQLFAIKKLISENNLKLQVWDRVDLILHIFAKHARSSEAKLQIEVASMRHMGPRIYGMGYVLSRQAGGIGTVGIGETNTELMKRHWRAQIKKVQDKLQKHTEERKRQLDRRAKSGIKTVSLVGYTNAGKTSLFNSLTSKQNSVENTLFVTLDSSVGKVFLPNRRQEILVADTIGFIKNLPPSLIDAFRSTLLESLFADILVIVIDSSDEEMENKLFVVEKILFDLGVSHKKRIYVFNKIDVAKDIDRKKLQESYAKFTPQFISTKTKEGISSLLGIIEASLLTQKSYDVAKPQKKIVHLLR